MLYTVVLQHVVLRFIRTFKLENGVSCDSDNVNIFDGDNATDPLIQSFCGTSHLNDVLTTGNNAFVTFVSGNSRFNSVFQIRYAAVIPVEGKNMICTQSFSVENDQTVMVVSNSPRYRIVLVLVPSHCSRSFKHTFKIVVSEMHYLWLF